ncbi:MAG: ribokinase [Prevotella sp.]|nr:ribokinase [Prevotella sp.]
MSKIVVIGSANTDMTVKTSHLPLPGETILGGNFFMNQGGKGANQAVAVQRLGGDLMFVAKLGADVLGKQTLNAYASEGMDTRFIVIDEQVASGVALICVDNEAENSIVVASGANMQLKEQDVDPVLEEIQAGDILLMQLEIPLSTVVYAARKACQRGAKVILNPAPATALPQELFQYLDMITPNRIEAAMLTGIATDDEKGLKRAVQEMCSWGVKNVIVTLGSQGSFVHEGKDSYYVEACKVEPVDTTAAGDTFNGTVCVGLAEGMTLKQAVQMAAQASALAVTKFGAQVSIPYRKDLSDF